MNRPIEKHQRQVHLDFHTSPFIKDVSVHFDAQAFAQRMKAAHVNSVTVFAKCHHGLSYYPTKLGKVHPHLHTKDQLGEMIDALHVQGIRAPLYTTVGWEEVAAHEHPEWRQMKKDWTFADVEGATDWKTQQPAGWKFLDFCHPGYLDFLEAHFNELLDNYTCDGFFIDILFYHPRGSWSESARAFRKEHGLLEDTPENHVMFELLVQEAFAKRFYPLIKAKAPNASVFFNAANSRYSVGTEGVMRRADNQTHFEIESLPSGFWGYYHFPRIARQLSHKGKFWFGMTGKFQKAWGDFGGLKPQAALEYECFRSQALGGGNSVGDQLHPRGVLDEDSYNLIGAVYEQLEAAEPFYENSTALPTIGVGCPNYVGVNEDETSKSEEGVVLMLEELHYDCAVIDDDFDLTGFKLIILPDTAVISDKFTQKLKAYHQNGGKLLITYRSGHGPKGDWKLDWLPLQHEGETEKLPTYWQATDALAGVHQQGERVFYQAGLNVKPGAGTTTLVERVLPYFRRTDLTFCGHFQTPPDQIDQEYPAVIGAENLIYFADPVFNEYRQSGNIFIRDITQAAIESLIGKPEFGYGLTPTIMLVPRRREHDLLLTLLHYIPIRKSLDIDVIEQGQSFYGEELRFEEEVQEVYCVTTQEKLAKNEEGAFVLPKVRGRLLLEFKGYFA